MHFFVIDTLKQETKEKRVNWLRNVIVNDGFQSSLKIQFSIKKFPLLPHTKRVNHFYTLKLQLSALIAPAERQKLANYLCLMAASKLLAQLFLLW